MSINPAYQACLLAFVALLFCNRTRALTNCRSIQCLTTPTFVLGDYQEFRARGRFSSLADEPFAEDDGELGLGLEPFARRPFPFVSRVVQNQV